MLKWTYLPNTGIYLLHTSQKSVLDPMAGPDWYESSKKYQIPVAASYGKKKEKSDTKPGQYLQKLIPDQHWL
jgi:hypothetical protein